MTVRITPPWWRTWWFKTLIGLAAVLTALALYAWRIHQITCAFNARIEERVSERTRSSRELHDSLLQGFQGLLFRLQAVRDLLPERAADAIVALDRAMERGDEVIAEGREAVDDLRSRGLSASDLSDALTSLVEELGSEAGARSVSYRVVVEGQPRPLSPLVRDDVYQIARAALRSAAQYGQARHIEAELHYGDTALSLRIRDDGVGLESRCPRHEGLHGMRARAESFGGRLDVWSEHGAGTETELSIPADIAYGHDAPAARLRRHEQSR
jgi:signal transduction histidine kinase